MNDNGVVIKNECNALKIRENNPLVSVIVPIYNVAPYLPQCIESICNQSYTNLEIILVDDASTDASGKICDNYAKKDKRIQVIHKSSNEGLVVARKSGMKLATGELIGNVDGDDWIESSMFEGLVEQYKTDDSDIVQCGYIEEGGKNISYVFKEYVDSLTDKDCNGIIESWLTGNNILLESQVVTKIYRRILFQKCYEKVPDSMSNGEDFVFFVNLVRRLSKVSSISTCYYHYRVRNDSLSHKREGINLLLKEDSLTFYLVSLMHELYPDISSNIIENWVLKRKMLQLKNALKQYDFNIPFYKYPSVKTLFEKKIIVYGAGAVGRDYIMQLSEYEEISIVGWVDKNAANYDYEFRRVNEVSYIQYIEWDMIIVAVLNEKIAETIKNDLVKQYGIEERKIVWKYKREPDFTRIKN